MRFPAESKTVITVVTGYADRVERNHRGTPHRHRHRRVAGPRPRPRPRARRRRVARRHRRPGRRRAARAPSAASPGVVAVPGDVTDAAHRRRPRAPPPRGRIDLLVNNAGGLGPSPLPALADYPLDALADLFDVNVVAPLGLIQAALPAPRAAAPSSSTSRPTPRSRPTRAGAATAPPRRRSTTLGRVLAAEHPDLRVLIDRPRRHAHPDAPGRLPRRGHLRPPAARGQRARPSSPSSTATSRAAATAAAAEVVAA